MHARAFTFALTLAAVSSAAASDIYKCVDGEATTYQATPCARGQVESRLHAAAAHRAPEIAPTVRVHRPTAPWRNRALELGMSDDEVLNLPAWGKPTRIVRTRLPREWREIWTYGQPVTGQRELTFVNARLAEIVAPAPAPIARLTPQ